MMNRLIVRPEGVRRDVQRLGDPGAGTLMHPLAAQDAENMRPVAVEAARDFRDREISLD